MPALLLAVYLYSHDKSTLTWVYMQYPKLFDHGLALCYPLYLMHWPVGCSTVPYEPYLLSKVAIAMLSHNMTQQVMLMLQDSAAYITNKGVSVIMIIAVCMVVSAMMDAYVITPLEDG